GSRIAFRNIGWPTSQELVDCTISCVNLVGASEVGNCGKSSCSNRHDARGAKVSVLVSCRDPQSEMSASRMANDDDLVQIKIKPFVRQLRKMIHCGCDIVESPGPAAAGCSQSSVLDIPDCV